MLHLDLVAAPRTLAAPVHTRAQQSTQGNLNDTSTPFHLDRGKGWPRLVVGLFAPPHPRLMGWGCGEASKSKTPTPSEECQRIFYILGDFAFLGRAHAFAVCAGGQVAR